MLSYSGLLVVLVLVGLPFLFKARMGGLCGGKSISLKASCQLWNLDDSFAVSIPW